MSVTQDTSPDTGFRVRGWHVAAGVTAFFAIVTAVLATFTVLAVRSYPGEVSVTPYEDGLLYNRKIAQVEAQQRLGWRATAAATPGLVVVELYDRTGGALEGLALTASLERPATDAGRISPRFVETAPGRYEATTGAIAGAWDLRFEARDSQGRRFEGERRLTWR